jgi:hypothetical protein
MALEILVLALDKHKNVVICRCICFYVQGVGRETIACFVDNSGIGDHHCLNFLFLNIIYKKHAECCFDGVICICFYLTNQ